MLDSEFIGSVREVMRGEGGRDDDGVAFRRQVHEELRGDLGIVWGEVSSELVLGIDTGRRGETEVGY